MTPYASDVILNQNVIKIYITLSQASTIPQNQSDESTSYIIYSNQLIINPKINEIKRSNHEAKEWKSLLCHKIQQGLKKKREIGYQQFWTQV